MQHSFVAIYQLLILTSTSFPYVAVGTNSNDDFADVDHIFVFAIYQLNIDAVNQKLMIVSDPRSTGYGRFWTDADVKTTTSNTYGKRIINKYFQRNGVKMVHETLHGEYLVAMASATIWESLLNRKLYEYDHDSNCRQPTRFNNYTLDKNISSYVSAVFRVYRAPQYNPQMRKSVFRQVLHRSLKIESNKWYVRDSFVSPWNRDECGIQGMDKNRAR